LHRACVYSARVTSATQVACRMRIARDHHRMAGRHSGRMRASVTKLPEFVSAGGGVRLQAPCRWVTRAKRSLRIRSCCTPERSAMHDTPIAAFDAPVAFGVRSR
jgi:hypothetical protein